MRRFTIGLAALAVVLPGAALADVQYPKKLLAMTPEAFEAAAVVHDDRLEFETVISTEPAFKAGGKSVLRTVMEDNHLRAIVDKRTGATRYEVHQFIRYAGPRRAYTGVNYATADGLQHVKPLLAQHGADYCPDSETNLGCSLSKRIAFSVNEADLRAVAASYGTDRSPGLTFKLKDETGKDWRDGIAPAEVTGLLRAADAYRSKLNALATAGAPQRTKS